MSQAALALSALGDLPTEVQAELVEGAVLVDVPAGGTFLRVGGPYFASVVVSGLIRTFLSSAEGRELTVRYTRPGDINGVAALYARPLTNISSQAITDSRVLLLRTETVVGVADRDPRSPGSCSRTWPNASASYIHALASTTLSPLHENVVRHLLDIASVDSSGRLVVALSQQQLAANVGTVREVIGRILRDLKDEGLLLTGRDEIVLLDASGSTTGPGRAPGEDFVPRCRDAGRRHRIGVRRMLLATPTQENDVRPRADPSDIDALAASFSGTLIRPDDPRYPAARMVWNGAIDRYRRSSSGRGPTTTWPGPSGWPASTGCRWRCAAAATTSPAAAPATRGSSSTSST